MTSSSLIAKLALRVRDQEIASHHAEHLAGLGFQITNVSGRGVSFTGPVELFERVFRSGILTKASQPQFVTEPEIPDDIRDQAESIYFPTKPTFYK